MGLKPARRSRRVGLRRVYEPSRPGEGKRFLVDRVWPRGLSREEVGLEGWLREVAPSTELRRWFGHRPERWEAFRARYARELDEKPETLEPLLKAARRSRVTLLYGARDRERNNAVALRDYLERRLVR